MIMSVIYTIQSIDNTIHRISAVSCSVACYHGVKRQYLYFSYAAFSGIKTWPVCTNNRAYITYGSVLHSFNIIVPSNKGTIASTGARLRELHDIKEFAQKGN